MVDESPSTQVGELIQRAREAKSMSQADLAQALGIRQQSVSKWEAGLSTPSKRRLGQVADVLGITVGELLSIDSVVITHPDQDHVGSTVELFASGTPLSELAELDPEGYERVMGIAQTLLDHARARREES